MTDPLFLASTANAKQGDEIWVRGAEGRHAATVKRTRQGESVYLSDGEGNAIHGNVIVVGKAEICVKVERVLKTAARPHRWIGVQALAKGERSDIAVEALTELGVDEIIAWQASRSIVRWQGKAEKGVEKWRLSAEQAAKQSRRFTIPKVSYASTSQICQRISAAANAIVLYENASTSLAKLRLKPSGEVLFIVGPEGGISVEEIAAFKQAGAEIMGLGDEILRTSTAGLVALAQLKMLDQLQG